MLADTLSVRIPGVSGVLDKLDAMRAKFLAVPANTRLALDKLARVRRMMNRTDTAPVTAAANEKAQAVENNLKRVQTEWNVAAERFSTLDALRKGQKTLTLDSVTMASQLAVSAGYVIKNSDKSIAAVDALANEYLTEAQRAEIGTATTGAPAVPTAALLAIAGIGALLFFRRR